ncbi:MAG TPA: RNA polymerase sigma factor [Vicinamibacteria bacterium]|nr:RNA polymerase sigma factor [Vicinamibacteria bacterium]
MREGDELVRESEARIQDSSSLAFRVAYGVLRQRQDAEDVAQEALVRALQRMASLRDRERFRAWLVRITWRAALDRRRADVRRGRRELAIVPDESPPDAEAVAIGSEHRQLVWQAVDALPDKLRLVVVLSAIEGHDTREVAALAGTSEGTVKSRMHRARKELAKRLTCLKSTTT